MEAHALIAELNDQIEVTCIDLAEGMLNQLKKKFSDKNIKIIRIRILKNHFNKNYTNANNFASALNRLSYEQDKVAKQFYEMLNGEEEAKAILER